MEGRCPYADSCAVFKYFRSENTKDVYTTAYCEGTFDFCERKKRQDIGKMVPDKLLPTGRYLMTL